MSRFVFAVLFHEYPSSARQLIFSILRYYPDAIIYYGLDRKDSFLNDLSRKGWDSIQEHRLAVLRWPPKWNFFPNDPRIRYVIPQREYSWKNLHRFLFDVIEQSKQDDYEWLICLDSDSMLCGTGIRDICKGTWDFSSRMWSLDKYMCWYQGKIFRKNWNYYEALVKDLSIQCEPHNYSTIFAFFVLSKKATSVLRNFIPRLEHNRNFQYYEDPSRNPNPLWEAFLPQFLSDLGLECHDVYPQMPGYRWRPFWTIREYNKAIWFYHPINRYPRDPFRVYLQLFHNSEINYDHDNKFSPG